MKTNLEEASTRETFTQLLVNTQRKKLAERVKANKSKIFGTAFLSLFLYGKLTRKKDEEMMMRRTTTILLHQCLFSLLILFEVVCSAVASGIVCMVKKRNFNTFPPCLRVC